VRRINIASRSFEYNPEDPPGFRSGRKRLGPLLGASKLGASVYELPPGEALCPYHYEYGEEEWLIVLEGRPAVRCPHGIERLEPWDVVCFPRGPDGAHAVRNDTAETVTVLMFSELTFPTATAYPDSDKVGLWTGNKDEDLIARRASAVDYWTGETPPDDPKPATGQEH
jgi:uncharacterized cupin superfamily protein